MFAEKGTKLKLTKLSLLGLLAVTFVGCTKAQEFEVAVKRARKAQLTNLNSAGKGVPFYTEHTLDPTWSNSAAIVTLPKIDMLDQNGRKQDESLLDGKITFVAFFFSSCRGFCPIFLKNLQKVEQGLSRYPDVQYVGISVDPETDRPKRLSEYYTQMEFNRKTWRLLTGDRRETWNLAKETFGAEVFDLPKSKGQVAHSEHFYVFDEKRRLRGVLKGTRVDVQKSAEKLVASLRASGEGQR